MQKLMLQEHLPATQVNEAIWLLQASEHRGMDMCIQVSSGL